MLHDLIKELTYSTIAEMKEVSYKMITKLPDSDSICPTEGCSKAAMAKGSLDRVQHFLGAQIA